MPEEDLIRVKVEDVAVTNQGPVVLLSPLDDPEHLLPIFIDPGQAMSIHAALNQQVPPRPLTHDLFSSVVQELGAFIEKIIIEDLAQNTYFAKLFIGRDGEGLVVDARPSDCIALAVRSAAPIFVRNHVFTTGRVKRSAISETIVPGDKGTEDLGVEP